VAESLMLARRDGGQAEFREVVQSGIRARKMVYAQTEVTITN